MSSRKSDSNLPLRIAALLVVAGFAIALFLIDRGDEKPGPASANSSPDASPESGELPGAGVRLNQDPDGRWQLIRNGQPYFIKGAGGSKHLDDLVAAGGNSIRTWGIDDETEALLDQAHELGLSVTLGYWMGHKRHGFDYHDEAQVQTQLDDMLAAVRRYKDHPAVLIWGVGNEVETEIEDDPIVWHAINDAAKAIKEIDPNHPTMVVLAELGIDESKAKAVAAHCPDIDIIGINTYDGATSAAARLAKHNFGKPSVITEYGPPLFVKDSLGSQREATSTQKGELYAEIYREGILAESATCLGSYAFFWDSKLELTDTYFGQFLASGERLAQVEVFHELFDGPPPANRCPVVESLTLEPQNRTLRSGETLNASLPAVDPDGDTLTYQWELKDELNRTTGGDAAEGSPPIAGAIQSASGQSAVISAPSPGSYRLYVRVLDGQGNAATASASVLVEP